MGFGEGLGIGRSGRSDRRLTPETHGAEGVDPHDSRSWCECKSTSWLLCNRVAVLGRRPSHDRDQSSLKTMWSQ